MTEVKLIFDNKLGIAKLSFERNKMTYVIPLDDESIDDIIKSTFKGKF